MGYRILELVRDLEQKCSELGFRMAKSRYGSSSPDDYVVIVPKDDSLPIYSRDTEIYRGSFDELKAWLRGAQWAREYDRKLMGKNIDVKRERKEQDYRNEELVRILKNTESKTK